MRNVKNTSPSQSGFTLIELIILIMIVGFLASIVLPAYQDYLAREKRGLCGFSESKFLEYVGGVAAGTALSASIAGDSFVLIVTQSSILVGTAPAVAPAVTLVAGTGAVAYGALKAYCSRHEATDLVMAWHQSMVDKTSNGMTLAVEKHGELVDYTSRTFEGWTKKD